jgi:hypothetical protein
MPQITQCPHCRGQLQVREENLGQTIRCPLCNGLFKIAAPQAPPPPVVNVEVIEPPAPPPPPPAPPPKPKPSGAASKPATKPSQKARPTPAQPPAEAERPRRPKTPAPAPAPPAPAAAENPFALGGLGGSPGAGPAALNFEEGQPQPHRGGMVLALGLAGLVFSLCCFPAGFILGGCSTAMGNRDLHLMARRRMDRTGKGMTRAGKILGIVAIVFSVINLAVTVWRLVVFFTSARV